MLTPFGIYVYNILAMGLSNVTEVFDMCMCEVLQGLKGLQTLQMTFWCMVLHMTISRPMYLYF